MNLYQGFGNNQSYYQPQRTNTIIPPSQQPQPAFIGLKGRPVSSLEEARAAAIDFDGSVFFFPDLANKRIYTKQINLDGTASMNMYEYKEVPTEAFNSSNFVTRALFLNVPRGCCQQISIENTSTSAVSVENASLIIERVA